jgi:hypothetical protein
MQQEDRVGLREIVVLIATLSAGCPDEPPGGDATATGMTTGSSSGETTSTTGMVSADETAGTDTTNEGTIDCPVVKDPLPAGTFPEVSEPEEVIIEVPGLCDDLEGMGLVQTVDVEVRHPAVALDGTWPMERLPLLIFIHGNGQLATGYEHLLDPLAREGFIVANIDAPLNEAPEVRAARVLCVNRWFAAEWPERNDHLNCDVAYMGHSNSGYGVVRAADLAGNAPSAPENQMTRTAVVDIAPRGVDAEQLIGPEGVAFLSLQGSRDEQVPGGAIRNYDRVAPEQAFTPTDVGKVAVWAYHVEHDAFGGSGLLEAENLTPLDVAEMSAKGEAIAVGYIVPFLRYAVLGENGGLRDYFTGDAFPPGVQVAGWWDYLPGNPAGEPRIFTSFTVDQRTKDEARLQIDTLDRAIPGSLSPSTLGQPVAVQLPRFAARVEVGTANAIAPVTRHDTEALLVAWDPADAGSSIRWETVGLDLVSATHLSLRVGTVPTVDGVSCTATAAPPASFTIELDDGMGAPTLVSTDAFAEIPSQDLGGVVNPQGAQFCVHDNFMRTVRIPLSPFCDELENLQTVGLTFGLPGTAPSGRVLIDSLEFTSSPFDAGDGCP